MGGEGVFGQVKSKLRTLRDGGRLFQGGGANRGHNCAGPSHSAVASARRIRHRNAEPELTPGVDGGALRVLVSTFCIKTLA